ncbi:MAG: AAA family ATPase [Candidatus Acidiferrales bacterium]
MVLNYYNLQRQPFGVEPDPRFLLMSDTHKEALASLTYALHEERGFMVLTAPPGMGKTTLLFRLLESLRDRARTVFLFQTQCDPGDFYRYLVRDLGLAPGPDQASIHDQLNQVLLEEARLGRRFVLVVDEAQGLQPAVLETIRLLSDFESPGRKMLQIIVAGQLGLVETLLRRDMEQLRQRISVVASLKPFNREEVASYVGHRLAVAGYQASSLFTEEALDLIAHGSKGIPRKINNICFNALSLGYALKRKQIGRDVVEEVLADLQIESLLPAQGAEAPSSGPKLSSGVPTSLLEQSHPPRMRNPIGRIALMTAALAVVAFAYNWTSPASSLRPPSLLRLLSPTRHNEATLAELPSASASPAPDSNVAARIRPQPSVVVVAPGQTLSEISQDYLGTYSPATVARLQALNPTLIHPDHIEAGGQIRLPASATGTEGRHVAGADSIHYSRSKP